MAKRAILVELVFGLAVLAIIAGVWYAQRGYYDLALLIKFAGEPVRLWPKFINSASGQMTVFVTISAAALVFSAFLRTVWTVLFSREEEKPARKLAGAKV